MSIRTAFEQICPDAEIAQTRFVSLYARVPFYGGPQEGGWWGEDVVLHATKKVRTQDEAEKIHAGIVAMAKELADIARRRFGEQCLRELEAAEERGIDPESLPEVNGEETYYVVIEETPGSHESQGSRVWDD